MRSVTSFFNAGLLRKNLQRSWPLCFLYLLVWCLILPMGIGMQFRYQDTTEGVLHSLQRYLYQGGAAAALVMAVIFGCLMAAVMYSYLMSARSVGMMHALPISRRSLFFTQFISGLLELFGVHLLTGLLTALVVGCYGCLSAPVLAALLSWLGLACGEAFFFYVLAVFCAMVTGQLLAIPVFYGILNLLLPGLEWLLRMFASMTLYGGGNLSGISYTRWFFPVYQLAQKLDMHEDAPLQGQVYGRLYLEGWGTLLIYVAAAAVLLLLTYLLYCKRPSESAGDVVAIGWMRPIFKYGASLCGALALGQLFYYILFPNYTQSHNYSLPGVILCMIAGALLIYFAAEMLLRKSFRVFRSGWRGAGVMAALLVLLGLGMHLDVTGFEGRVPQASQVETVRLGLSGIGGSDVVCQEETIEKILQLHKAVVAEKSLQKSRAAAYEGENWAVPGSLVRGNAASIHCVWLSLRYDLKNGSSLSRNYSLYLQPGDAQRADSVLNCYLQLCNTWEARAIRYFGSTQLPEAGAISGGYLTYMLTGDGEDSAYREENLDSAFARELYEAMRQDMEAADMDMQALFDGGEVLTLETAQGKTLQLENVEFFYVDGTGQSAQVRQLGIWGNVYNGQHVRAVMEKYLQEAA